MYGTMRKRAREVRFIEVKSKGVDQSKEAPGLSEVWESQQLHDDDKHKPSGLRRIEATDFASCTSVIQLLVDMVRHTFEHLSYITVYLCAYARV